MKLYKAGAIAYMAWGALHVLVGGIPLFLFLKGPVDHALGALLNKTYAADAIDPDIIATLSQHAFNLLAGGIAVFCIAFLNWRNDRTAYWINLLLGGVLDLGFVMLVVIPGHIALSAGLPGPLIWLGGALMTTAGRRNASDAAPLPS